MSKSNWNSLEEEFFYYTSLIQKKEQSKDVSRTIAAGKILIDRIKILKEYAEEINDANKRDELIRIITDFHLEFAFIQDKLANKVEENHLLKRKITNLEKENQKLKNSELKLLLKDKLYYKADSNDSPFCTVCYDTNKKITRLITLPPTINKLGQHQCRVCNTLYHI